MAALEQLQAPYAEWAARTAALAQRLPGAIAASAPQQAPAVQVGTSTCLLRRLGGLQPASETADAAHRRQQVSCLVVEKRTVDTLQAALAARQAWLCGAAAQAAGLVRLATAVLALERSCDVGSDDVAAQNEGSFAQHAALLAQLTELAPQLAAAQRQVRLPGVCCFLQACRQQQQQQQQQ